MALALSGQVVAKQFKTTGGWCQAEDVSSCSAVDVPHAVRRHTLRQSIWKGKARQGKANEGKARQGKARQGKARSKHKGRQGKAIYIQQVTAW